MTDLKAIAELAHGYAKYWLIGTDRKIMPMFLISRPEGNDVIGCAWKDDEEKRTMVINVALEVVEKGADAWSLLSEIWFAHTYAGDPEKRRPMDRPDRKEGVNVIVSDGAKVESWSWEIIRDKEGKCAELIPQEEAKQILSSWIATAINKAKALHTAEQIRKETE